MRLRVLGIQVIKIKKQGFNFNYKILSFTSICYNVYNKSFNFKQLMLIKNANNSCLS